MASLAKVNDKAVLYFVSCRRRGVSSRGSRASRAFCKPARTSTQPVTSNQSQQMPTLGTPSYAPDKPMPHQFGYNVQDYQGNNFGHSENSDGKNVQGEYRVQLPDGRTQIVTYNADHSAGFVADVKFEGEAQYPAPSPSYSPPAPSYSPPAPSYSPPAPSYNPPSPYV
ncbi:uncharacterized protein LOC143023146 [Oratosquilla oratoria]|uniref:uncharacterized protein LOC143023146 n=1 Tax=Oratosquilla oratoria TaxID=337810 RepID=UPI003F76DAEE